MVDLLSFGIEEETMLVDPVRLRPVDAGSAYDVIRADHEVGAFVSREYLPSQLEFSSPVYTDIADAVAGLGAFRAAVAEAAGQTGARAWNSGTPFDTPKGRPDVTHSPRYEKIARGFGAVVDDHQISALHIHVGVPDRATGVRASNAVRPWLPTLLALGANSPHWRGRDTGFASWRSILMRRWTTSGCPPVFADDDDYGARVDRLVGVGGTADAATLAWNLRLSETHPTIEFRVFDAQVAAGQSVLLAAICRALVRGIDDARRPALTPDAELLDAALWHAARDGMTDRLVHPETGSLEPVAVVVAALRRRIDHDLRELGDEEVVDEGLHRLLSGGGGATLQRAGFARSGIAGLLDVHTPSSAE